MDNDTWLDLLAVHGHVYPQMDTLESGPGFRQPILLHRNNRDGTFDEVSQEAGLRDIPSKSRRGAAFGDIFNNGNVDVVVLNVGEPPSILINTNHDLLHRVLFKLVSERPSESEGV